MRAGFDVYDVTMTQLQDGSKQLGDYTCIAIPGGFSYGDAL